MPLVPVPVELPPIEFPVGFLVLLLVMCFLEETRCTLLLCVEAILRVWWVVLPVVVLLVVPMSVEAPDMLLPLVAGVFAGSALWWLFLSGAVSLVRHRLAPGVLVWINRASGAAIMVFGILAMTAAML